MRVTIARLIGLWVLSASFLSGAHCARFDEPASNQVHSIELNMHDDREFGELDRENSANWMPGAGNLIAAGYPGGSFWVRFRISRAGTQAGSPIVVLFHSHRLDRIELHVPGRSRPLVGGNSVARLQRDSNGAEPAFTLPVAPPEATLIYARLQGEAYLNFPIEIYAAGAYAQKRQLGLIVQSVGYLFAGALIIVCLVLFSLQSRKDAALVMVFIALNALSLWSGFGNAYFIFWPEFPVWQPRLHYFFCLLALVAILTLAGLRPEVSTRAGRLLLSLAGVVTMGAAMASLLPLPALARILIYAGTAFLVAVSLAASMPLLAGVRAARRRLIVAAWLFYFGPIALQHAYDLGALPYHELYVHAPALAFPLVALLATVAIALPPARARDGLSEDAAFDESASDRLQGVDQVRLLARLTELLESERVYRDPALRIEDLAEKVALPPYLLSQFLNRQLHVSYATLINAYRVREILQRFSGNSRDTILSIALAAGFDTKSNFNKTFKKMTGMTPRDARRTGASEAALATVSQIVARVRTPGGPAAEGSRDHENP